MITRQALCLAVQNAYLPLPSINAANSIVPLLFL